jgi:hypothetical protein
VTLCKLDDRYKARGNSCLVASFRTNFTDRSEGRTRFLEAIAFTMSGHNMHLGREHIP